MSPVFTFWRAVNHRLSPTIKRRHRWMLGVVFCYAIWTVVRGTASKASFGRVGFPLLLNFCFVLIEISHNDEGSGSKKDTVAELLTKKISLQFRYLWRCPYMSENLFFPLRQQRNLEKSQKISHKHCSTSHQEKIALCGVWELLIVAANCSRWECFGGKDTSFIKLVRVK